MLNALRSAVALSVGLGSAVLLGDTATAQQYDNPAVGGLPCVVIEAQQSSRQRSGDASTYGSTTRIENLCNIAVEVEFCLSDVGGEEASLCEQTTLRPLADTVLVKRDHPTRLTGPRIAWRYLN